MSDKKGGKKRALPFHGLIIAALSFILVLIVGEIVVYVVQTVASKTAGVAEGSIITLFVIPSIALLITCAVIYLNHRTLQTSKTLIDALNRVADGDYNAKIPYKRLDGFNSVYENFNKMTEELKSVKALREDFVHDFSHEFKTPIASINGFANLLLEDGVSEDERRQIIKIIADESDRLSRLAESMLALSKIENQQFLGESKKFRLDLQIKDCIILLQRQWEEKNIEISSSLARIAYTGDENLLKQVWLNLLSNAIKYTPQGGRIEVGLKRENGNIVACVKDSGIGIPQEAIPKIFEKYYQVSSGSGNGLGLAICKRICELSGGQISVTSEVGKGSVFTVTL